jgi:hypothetical protein
MPRNSKYHIGGGSWDEYCYCCGLPFMFGFEAENRNLADGSKLSEEQYKQVSGKEAELEKTTKWILKSIGLDSHNKVIFELGRGGDIGHMFMEKVHRYPGAQAIYDEGSTIFISGEIATMMEEDDDSPQGLAIHKDCAAVIETAIGRPLKPEDEKKIREINKPSEDSRDDGPCFKKYNEQFYTWTDAVLNEPLTFFASPKSDAAQRARILACNAKLIAALKAGGGRKRRTNRKKANNKTRRN